MVRTIGAGEVYAHDVVRVPSGSAWEFLEVVRAEAVVVAERFGWTLAGAWVTAMGDDREVILLWAIPSWDEWAAFEDAQRTDVAAIAWRNRLHELTLGWDRTLLVDAPLSPFRTLRQPREEDRNTYQLPA